MYFNMCRTLYVSEESKESEDEEIPTLVPAPEITDDSSNKMEGKQTFASSVVHR